MSRIISTIKQTLKRLFGRRLVFAGKVLLFGVPKSRNCRYFNYDCERFYRYSGVGHPDSKETLVASIVILYHVLEKGLTMPQRKSVFGVDVVDRLIQRVTTYETKFGDDNFQVEHAIGVLKAYRKFRETNNASSSGDEKWERLVSFSNNHAGIPEAKQLHVTREAFYKDKEKAFPAFAHARHTLRNYTDQPLSIHQLQKAIDLAQTTPTACNRQYCRTHCISDKTKMARLLEIQGGNRGFGHLADKLLIVTADLEALTQPRERDDLFTNGGMYLMNLCYALFYFEIAHCVLNWSREPEEDIMARQILDIKPSETIIAILTCGNTPEQFDVALSPRKPPMKLQDVR